MQVPLPPGSPRPPIWMLATAAFLSQIAAATILCLAIAWIVTNRATPVEIMVCGGAALFGILAAALAYRGTLLWLLVAGTVDAAIAGGSLANTGALVELHRVVTALDPVLVGHLIVGFATIAAVLCAFAIPQARRYTGWQRKQIDRALRAKRL